MRREIKVPTFIKMVMPTVNVNESENKHCVLDSEVVGKNCRGVQCDECVFLADNFVLWQESESRED
ncbi:MAG: hypothetical protein GY799_21010 [Desulfobulbaceae bacterium]|nr:hypothetical protein [Desulfobulbaceae bacterium]